MRKLPLTAAEDLLEIIMRRYERASTIVHRTRGRYARATVGAKAAASADT